MIEKLVITTWIKKTDSENWQDDTQTYNKLQGYLRESKEWQKLLRDDLELTQKERRRNIAREQNLLLKEQAEKLNLTIKELKEKQKKERFTRNPYKTTKLDVERTNRMIQVGPALKDLKDQIDLIFEKAHINSKKLMPKVVERSLSKIETVTRLLESWIDNSRDD